MRQILHRLYADFFMPSRLREYRDFFVAALRLGYQVFSIRDFWSVLQTEGVQAGKKYLILRHDIDTDTATAKLMWLIECALGIRSSYYSRLSTLDVTFMREIERIGGEAS